MILSYPGSSVLDIDDPQLTQLRRSIIQEKRLLHAIYQEWYHLQITQLPSISGMILEIGSGAGFLQEVQGQLITTEVRFYPFVNAILDARRLPFSNDCLRAIVMTDVFHHIPNVEEFLYEAWRTLRPGGRVIMIEPWVTPWSLWIMQHFHSEAMNAEMLT